MKTQTQRVVDRLLEKGYADNFWAFHNYILRLGAVIHLLKKDGWEFDSKYGTGANKKNYYYYLTKKP